MAKLNKLVSGLIAIDKQARAKDFLYRDFITVASMLCGLESCLNALKIVQGNPEIFDVACRALPMVIEVSTHAAEADTRDRAKRLVSTIRDLRPESAVTAPQARAVISPARPLAAFPPGLAKLHSAVGDLVGVSKDFDVVRTLGSRDWAFQEVQRLASTLNCMLLCLDDAHVLRDAKAFLDVMFPAEPVLAKLAWNTKSNTPEKAQLVFNARQVSYIVDMRPLFGSATPSARAFDPTPLQQVVINNLIELGQRLCSSDFDVDGRRRAVHYELNRLRHCLGDHPATFLDIARDALPVMAKLVHSPKAVSAIEELATLLLARVAASSSEAFDAVKRLLLVRYPNAALASKLDTFPGAVALRTDMEAKMPPSVARTQALPAGRRARPAPTTVTLARERERG